MFRLQESVHLIYDNISTLLLHTKNHADSFIKEQESKYQRRFFYHCLKWNNNRNKGRRDRIEKSFSPFRSQTPCSIFLDILIIFSIFYLFLLTLYDVASTRNHPYNIIKPRILFLSPSMILESNNKIERNHRRIEEFRFHVAKYGIDDLPHPFITNDCIQQYEWQLESHPTCNSVHEVNIFDEELTIIGKGSYRDVWSWQHFFVVPRRSEIDIEQVVLKTLRYNHDFTPLNTERHRIDAVSLDRLASSEFIIDIYASCVTSGLFEYGDSGTLDDVDYEFKILSNDKKLHAAYQVSHAIADVHSIENEYIPAIIHGDIKPKNFVNVDGRYKLNSFNDARFVRKDVMNDRSCEIDLWSLDLNEWKSPEEFREDTILEENYEKSDVYSMGNVFHYLLTSERPFEYEGGWDDSIDLIHTKSELYNTIKLHSIDPVEQALVYAIDLCQVFDPKKRSSAIDIVEYFDVILETINP